MDAPKPFELPEFYLVVVPGLEQLAVRELCAWFPDLKASQEPLTADILHAVVGKGGLTVRAPLQIGLAMNRCLKIPTRILLRVAKFGCRDFPKLYKKISGFAWAEWLGAEAENAVAVDFRVSTQSSRLFIKKRIEKTCLDARPSSPTAKAKLEAFVRIDHDVCTLSFDTSGEMLHKRGVGEFKGEAPLRETFAASILWHMLSQERSDQTQLELIDPMAGSGTFLTEATTLMQPIETRSFAFELFKQGAQEALALELKCTDANRFASIVGFDSDQKTLDAAKHNAEILSPGLQSIQWLNRDVFGSDLSEMTAPSGARRWLVTNPPYGERLKVKGRLGDFYEDLFLACERTLKPDLACFLLPEKSQPLNLRIPPSWTRRPALKFSNGGIPVVACLFARKN